MRILRALELRLSGQDGCERCRRSWRETKGHVTKLGTNRGMYPLCESCWSKLTVEARLPYYAKLLERWTGLDDPDDPIPSWDFVKNSVFKEVWQPKSLSHAGLVSAAPSGDDDLVHTWCDGLK